MCAIKSVLRTLKPVTMPKGGPRPILEKVYMDSHCVRATNLTMLVEVRYDTGLLSPALFDFKALEEASRFGPQHSFRGVDGNGDTVLQFESVAVRSSGDPLEFPTIDVSNVEYVCRVPVDELRMALEICDRFAENERSIRFNLRSILLERIGTQKLLAVACDGHKLITFPLACVTINAPQESTKVSQVLIPAEVRKPLVRVLRTLQGDCVISWSEDRMVIESQTTRIVIRTETDCRYPNWRSVTPKTQAKATVMITPDGTARVLESFARATKSEKNQNSRVLCTIADGRLTIKGECDSHILDLDIQSVTDGVARFWLAPHNAAALFNATDGKLTTITFHGDGEPIEFECDSVYGLVMTLIDCN